MYWPNPGEVRLRQLELVDTGREVFEQVDMSADGAVKDELIVTRPSELSRQFSLFRILHGRLHTDEQHGCSTGRVQNRNTVKSRETLDLSKSRR